MTTNLPDLYAAVCAKRPELEVLGMIYRKFDGRWFAMDAWGCKTEIPIYQAAALILARWVEMLPAGYKLSKQEEHLDYSPDGVMWWVEDAFHEKHEGFAPTPLEALAAFYLEYQA